MKVLIIKRGNTKGRYYQGGTLKEIIRKFLQSKPNLMFIGLDNCKSHYEIFTVDTKTNRREIYVIPKYKISK